MMPSDSTGSATAGKPGMARNIVLVVLFALVVSSLILTNCLAKASPGVASLLELDKTSSNLEGRAYQKRPALSVASLADHTFQDGFERWLADSVPLRDGLLLSHAASQRACIALMDGAFGYPAYPTFFGSDVVYIPDHDAYTFVPEKSSETRTSAYRSFAEGLARVARDYPGKRFAVVVVGGYHEPTFNAAYDLVADPATPQQAVEVFEGVLSGVGNATVVYVDYEDADSYYHDFFRTDHHWNIYGMAKAYDQLAQAWGLDKFDLGKPEDFSGSRCSGATIRWGLVDVSEPVVATSHVFEGVQSFDEEGKPSESGDLNARWRSMDHSARFSDFYGSYFQGGQRFISEHSKGRALLLSNSYGQGLRWLLAEQYGTVEYYQALHPNKEADAVLEEMIEAYQPDDVVLVASPGDYMQAVSNHPRFFERAEL